MRKLSIVFFYVIADIFFFQNIFISSGRLITRLYWRWASLATLKSLKQGRTPFNSMEYERRFSMCSLKSLRPNSLIFYFQVKQRIIDVDTKNSHGKFFSFIFFWNSCVVDFNFLNWLKILRMVSPSC